MISPASRLRPTRWFRKPTAPSQFVVSKARTTPPYANIDDWTAYTGIKNAPTVKSAYGTPASYADVDVYYYCKSGSMVTVMFHHPQPERYCH